MLGILDPLGSRTIADGIKILMNRKSFEQPCFRAITLNMETLLVMSYIQRFTYC